MPLEMKRAKDGVRFEFADGEAETTVTLLPEDDQDTLVRKLRRIIALTEGEQPQEWRPIFQSPAGDTISVPVRTAPEAPPMLGEEQIGNGWATYAETMAKLEKEEGA